MHYVQMQYWTSKIKKYAEEESKLHLAARGNLLSTFMEHKYFMRYLTLEWFCSHIKFHTTTVIIDKRKVKILFFRKKAFNRDCGQAFRMNVNLLSRSTVIWETIFIMGGSMKQLDR